MSTLFDRPDDNIYKVSTTDVAEPPAQSPTSTGANPDIPGQSLLEDSAGTSELLERSYSSLYGIYEGPRLEPSRFVCGWCSAKQCGSCHTWAHSPGTGDAFTYNKKLPCRHACNQEKVDYLRSIFGARWKPDGTIPDTPTFDLRKALRMTPAPSNVTEVNEGIAPTTPNQEVAVSDTQTEAPVAEDTFQEYEQGEGTVSSDLEAQVEAAAPVVSDEPAEGGQPTADDAESEKKTKAPRTDLEPDVKAITDAFVTGEVKLEEGQVLTPHRISALVHERRGGEGKAPSAGAVSAVLERWEKYGFATLGTKPAAFVDYTDAGREKGLTAMKAEHRQALKDARAAEKAAKSTAASEPSADADGATADADTPSE